MGQNIKMTPLQMDALKEAVSIGAGNAASALSKMASSRVDMSVPKATIVPMSAIPKMVGREKDLKLLIRVNIIGDAPGAILITMSMASAITLSDILMERKTGQTTKLGPMDMSAIQEVGNIMTGNYLRALETFLRVPFRSSVPFIAMDSEGKILDGVLSELGQETDHAVVIETELKDKEHEIQTQFFLIPSARSLEKILDVLGVH
jgi:chemotaxis protein CheC